MSKKVFDDSVTARNPFGRIATRDGWMEGVVVTPLGFVWVYHEVDGTTRLDFVHNARLHMRTITKQSYTKAGLARIAAKFAREIAEARDDR